MAVVHNAELTPSKAELLAAWLPRQAWYAGSPAPSIKVVAAFRFDDPEGEVGIEILLASDTSGDSGAVMQVPLTYRAAPLPQGALVGEMEHSVLGHRFVYDGTSDPVYVAELARVILTGGREVDRFLDGVLVVPPNAATVHGSGSADRAVPPIGEFSTSTEGAVTTTTAGPLTLRVRRLPLDSATGEAPAGQQTLTAEWGGGAHRVVIATADLAPA